MHPKFSISLVLGLSFAAGLVGQSNSSAPALQSQNASLAAESVMLHDEYTVALTWNQAPTAVDLVVKNTSGQPWEILGVQSSSSAWIVSYPKVVPAKGSGVVSVLVESKVGAQTDMEVVRLKLKEGEKTLLLKFDRPPIYTFDSARLQWNQGETISKTATLTVGSPSISVKEVESVFGHQATVQKTGPVTYRITVTPKIGAKPGSFPVVIKLDPTIAGAAPTLTCTVVAKK